MINQEPSKTSEADLLIDAIHKKLRSNRDILQKSIRHGRLKWRRSNSGKSGKEGFDIDLELNV